AHLHRSSRRRSLALTVFIGPRDPDCRDAEAAVRSSAIKSAACAAGGTRARGCPGLCYHPRGRENALQRVPRGTSDGGISDMAELRTVPAAAPVEDVVRILREDGGVIIRDLIDARMVDAINAEVDALVDAANPAMRHLNPAIQIFFGDRTKHVGGIAGKSRTFATEVMIHPLYLGICDAILGPSCASYQLNPPHLIPRGPRAAHQYLHRHQLLRNLVPP